MHYSKPSASGITLLAGPGRFLCDGSLVRDPTQNKHEQATCTQRDLRPSASPLSAHAPFAVRAFCACSSAHCSGQQGALPLFDLQRNPHRTSPLAQYRTTAMAFAGPYVPALPPAPGPPVLMRPDGLRYLVSLLVKRNSELQQNQMMIPLHQAFPEFLNAFV